MSTHTESVYDQDASDATASVLFTVEKSERKRALNMATKLDLVAVVQRKGWITSDIEVMGSEDDLVNYFVVLEFAEIATAILHETGI